MMLLKLNTTASFPIEKPEDFFAELGGLHDADIDSLEWDTIRAELMINIDDIYSNFYQEPEYPGKLSVQFKVTGLSSLKVQAIQGKYPVRILSFKVSKAVPASLLSVIINFGEGRIEFECKGIHAIPLNS